MVNLNSSKKVIYIFLGLFISVCLFLFISDQTDSSFSLLLDNDIEVSKDSELIYYLNVSYDGVDVNGVDSSSGVVSNINSDVIYVEDKIPEGLIFMGFVTTSDGSIGAYREDNTSCLGKVVDDTPDSNGTWNSDNSEFTYHGLHYNANSRVVSFKVNNLQAGCSLVVGIKTKTPNEIDNANASVTSKRLDFYNIASAREKDLSVNSNLTHVYIGSENVNLYNVVYEYTGDIPLEAPSLPSNISYASGSNVGVLNDVSINGYSFSGWNSNDVEVVDGVFKMPSSNVTFTGSFTKESKYKVTYIINGDCPDNYILPSEKEYYENDIVSVDGLLESTVLDGYVFTGWKVI